MDATTHADTLRVTVDTLDLPPNRRGTITVTLPDGEQFVASALRGEDPCAVAQRRLEREGLKVLGGWTKTSAVTWTANARDWRPIEPETTATLSTYIDRTDGSTQ